MSDAAPIERAIEIAGSEAKLGAMTGYSQVAINKAKHRGKPTADMAVAIERALNGQVTRQQMRPDLFEPAEAS